MSGINEFNVPIKIPKEQVHSKFVEFFEGNYETFIDQRNLKAAGAMLFSLAVYRLQHVVQAIRKKIPYNGLLQQKMKRQIIVVQI